MRRTQGPLTNLMLGEVSALISTSTSS